MDIKSLMIGDWVKPQNVDASFRVGLIGADSVWNDADTHEWYYDELEPIPLTAEILEKNGFEKTWQDNFVYDNEDIGLIITFHPKETNYTNGIYDYIDIEKGCVTITEMPIEFVHQLQHVLRLCEVSIEIIEL